MLIFHIWTFKAFQPSLEWEEVVCLIAGVHIARNINLSQLIPQEYVLGYV